MPVFALNNIKKSFINGEVQEEILKGVNLSLKEGEITALKGASGSGKSTLLTIAAGLQHASSGQILFEGKDIANISSEQIRKIRASQFGFVFQFSHLIPFLTVEEQLMLMLDVSESKLTKDQKREEATALLRLVEMDHRRNAYPPSLSGGEKQRIAVARAIIHKPRVLFADEPTASLDSKRSKDIMRIIQAVTKKLNVATLLVTHDEDVLPFAGQVIEMRDGQILHG